jgi:hypothetical protein
VTPLCILDTTAINCIKNEYAYAEQYVFSFFVWLWDSLAVRTVQLALKQKDIEVKESDIIPLPMQMVRFCRQHFLSWSCIKYGAKVQTFRTLHGGLTKKFFYITKILYFFSNLLSFPEKFSITTYVFGILMGKWRGLIKKNKLVG